MSTALTPAEPISPELALVCPELAERVRGDWAPHPWQLVGVRPGRPAAGVETLPPPLPAWVAATLYFAAMLTIRVTVAVGAIAALALAVGLLTA